MTTSHSSRQWMKASTEAIEAEVVRLRTRAAELHDEEQSLIAQVNALQSDSGEANPETLVNLETLLQANEDDMAELNYEIDRMNRLLTTRKSGNQASSPAFKPAAKVKKQETAPEVEAMPVMQSVSVETETTVETDVVVETQAVEQLPATQVADEVVQQVVTATVTEETTTIEEVVAPAGECPTTTTTTTTSVTSTKGWVSRSFDLAKNAFTYVSGGVVGGAQSYFGNIHSRAKEYNRKYVDPARVTISAGGIAIAVAVGTTIVTVGVVTVSFIGQGALYLTCAGVALTLFVSEAAMWFASYAVATVLETVHTGAQMLTAVKDMLVKAGQRFTERSDNTGSQIELAAI